MMIDGGYEDGYRMCENFWGVEPGSLVRWLLDHRLSSKSLSVLDLGCGEGKNAAALAELGHSVLAADVSEKALYNAKQLWPDSDVTWRNANALDMQFNAHQFDLVISYGLIHCFQKEKEAHDLVKRCQKWTKPGGYNVLCAFNDRDQDLSAHPGFQPLLMPHLEILSWFSNWEILRSSDETLFETHPHNNIPHHHSMTRLIARKPDTC